MNLAVALALAAATLHLALTILFLSLSAAPGWRICRVLSAIALTAFLYNLGGVVFALPGLPDPAYLAAGRMTYVAAAAHAVAWLVFVFGGAHGAPRVLPAPIRWVAGVTLAVAVFFAATGLHLAPDVGLIEVPWAMVTYRLPVTTPWAVVNAVLLPIVFATVFGGLIWRYTKGERPLGSFLAGFAVYFVCVVVEALVANRVIVFLSPADLGMVAVVLPLAVMVTQRVVDDASRLDRLSGKLAVQVRERTEERDRAETALREAERLAALGRLAAGVGHEIANPLTYLQLSLDEVGEALTTGAPGAATSLANARDGAWRIQQVVEGLRTYSRPEGRVAVRTDALPDGRARITVTDTGPGITPEHLKRLSEPYFTTRASQGGLGLGLFVTRGIIDAHGGQLELRSELGQGTEVTVTLPGLPKGLAEVPASPPPIAIAPTPPSGTKPSVLIIDDEPLVVRVLSQGLSRDWVVATAPTGERAIEMIRQCRYDAVVCDLMMPGMSGMELASRMEALRPDLRARMLFLTGGAVTEAAETFLGRPDVRHLRKPVTIAALTEELRELMRAATGAEVRG